jgi:hypothetical protein
VAITKSLTRNGIEMVDKVASSGPPGCRPR